MFVQWALGQHPDQRYLPWPKGWSDGPARDVDRLTGNPDRPQPCRPPARRDPTAATPDPRHALALTLLSVPRETGSQPNTSVDDRGSPSSSLGRRRTCEAAPSPPIRRRFVVSVAGRGSAPYGLNRPATVVRRRTASRSGWRRRTDRCPGPGRRSSTSRLVPPRTACRRRDTTVTRPLAGRLPYIGLRHRS
jgi:hypothetical protein